MAEIAYVAIRKTTIKQAGTLALTGGGAYFAWRLTAGRLSSRPASGRGQRVINGMLPFDPAWNEGDPNYVQIDGTEYRIGTEDAAFAGARAMVRLTASTDRLLRAVETMFTREQLRAQIDGFRSSGRYPVQLLTPGQATAVRTSINAVYLWAVGLAWLDQLYKAVGPFFTPDIMPASLQREGRGMTCVTFAGNYLSPMSVHLGLQRHERPRPRRICAIKQGGWSVMASATVRAWSEAYPGIFPQPEVARMIDSLEGYGAAGSLGVERPEMGASFRPPARTMGIAPAAAAAWIVFAVVAGYVATIMMRGAGRAVGNNPDFLDAISETIEEATDCCFDEERPQEERSACCSMMERQLASLRSWEPALPAVLRLGMLVGIIGLGGYMTYRVAKSPRARKALGKAKRKVLPG